MINEITFAKSPITNYSKYETKRTLLPIKR